MEQTGIYRKKLEELDCFRSQDGPGIRTADQLKNLVDGLFGGRKADVCGTLEDRVFIGYYEGAEEPGQWLPEQAQPEQILELRIFSEDGGELYLFRRGGRLCGRFLREDGAGASVWRKKETNYIQNYERNLLKKGGSPNSAQMVYDIVYYFAEDPRNGMLQCVDCSLKKIYQKGEAQ